MRLPVLRSLIALVALACGCEASNPFYRPEGSAADGGTIDFAVSRQDQSPTLADLAVSQPVPDLTMPPPPPDMTKPVDGVGDPCKTACDCNSGLACLQGHCAQAQQGPVYCCQAMDCPKGENCQAMDGHYSQCGMGGGGGPQWCMFIPCMSDAGCKQSGCGFCNGMTKHCQ